MRPPPKAELLDALPADDPRARASRRDLRRLNYLLGHRTFMADAIRNGGGVLQRIADWGGGDGTFLLGLLRALPPSPATRQAFIVDRQAIVDAGTIDQFARLNWTLTVVPAEIQEWLSHDPPAVDATIANLFLHHFATAALFSLLAGARAHTRLFLSCDPRRNRIGRWGTSLLPLLGCNAVTRHDARVSVEGGFRGRELSRCWGAHAEWALTEQYLFPFSHGFVAANLI